MKNIKENVTIYPTGVSELDELLKPINNKTEGGLIGGTITTIINDNILYRGRILHQILHNTKVEYVDTRYLCIGENITVRGAIQEIYRINETKKLFLFTEIYTNFPIIISVSNLRLCGDHYKSDMNELLNILDTHNIILINLKDSYNLKILEFYSDIILSVKSEEQYDVINIKKSRYSKSGTSCIITTKDYENYQYKEEEN